MAISLDHKVSEFLNRNPELSATVDQQSRKDRRQLVNDMISVLPEVEKKLLLAQRDLEQTSLEDSVPAKNQHQVNAIDRDLGMSWEAVDRPATPTASAPIQQPNPLHAVPLSASTALRQSQAPGMGIYQAILHSNPGSPARSPAPTRPSSSLSQRRSLGVHHPQSPATVPSSPFSLPPRVPSFTKPGAAAAGVMQANRNVSGSPFLRQIAAGNLDRGQNLFITQAETISRRAGSPSAQTPSRRVVDLRPINGDGWSQPLSAVASPSPREDFGDMEVDEGKAEEPRQLRDAHQSDNDSELPGAFVAEPPARRPRARQGKVVQTTSTPARATPARKARAPATQPTSAPRRAKKATKPATVEQDEQEVDIPGAFPIPARRNLRSTSASHTPALRSAPTTDEESSIQASTKKTKKQPPARTTSAPRRTTRQQSVVSSVAEEDDEGNMKQLRRSNRLTSAAPSSPAQSITSEVTTQTRPSRASREPSATPRRTRMRTRNQPTLMEEEY